MPANATNRSMPKTMPSDELSPGRGGSTSPATPWASATEASPTANVKAPLIGWLSSEMIRHDTT